MKNNKILTVEQLKGLLGSGKTVTYHYEYIKKNKEIWAGIILSRLPGKKEIYVIFYENFPYADLDENIKEVHLSFNSVEDALDYIKKNTKLDIKKYVTDYEPKNET